jgi:hypothetical protein
MRALLQEIKSSLLSLIGSGIKALPAILVAIAILFLTRYAANLTRRMTAIAGRRMLKSQSL